MHGFSRPDVDKEIASLQPGSSKPGSGDNQEWILQTGGYQLGGDEKHEWNRLEVEMYKPTVLKGKWRGVDHMQLCLLSCRLPPAVSLVCVWELVAEPQNTTQMQLP